MIGIIAIGLSVRVIMGIVTQGWWLLGVGLMAVGSI
jgi:hypothetical protein